jgi:lipocalin
MISKILLIFLAVLSVVSCGFSWGRCPDVKYELKSFNGTAYMGKWYEVVREKSMPFERGTCQEATYTLNDDGTIKVYNTEIEGDQLQSVTGKAIPTDNKFQFKVSFSTGWFSKFSQGDYRVINTDYTNFAIVYSCTDLYVAKFEYFWILSREPTPTGDKLENFSNYVKSTFGFQDSQVLYTPQNYCGRQ